MDQFPRDFSSLVVLAAGTFFAAALFKWLSRKQQPRPVSYTSDPGPRVCKRFPGQRVYSIYQVRQHKWTLRFIYLGTGLLPLLMCLMYWRAVASHPGGMETGYHLAWVIPLGAVLWAALTILFLRTLIVYRTRTTITLNAEGVRFAAPKVGIFPRRDIFMQWAEIDGITPCSLRQPTVIQVFSGKLTFIFDSQRTREVAAGQPGTADHPAPEANSLYRDLLEYSGLVPALAPLASGKSRVGADSH
jgi:hypothetical protein